MLDRLRLTEGMAWAAILKQARSRAPDGLVKKDRDDSLPHHTLGKEVGVGVDCFSAHDRGGKIMEAGELAEKLAGVLRERPCLFSELLREFSQVEYRAFLLGWSDLRTRYQLDRDEQGRYLLKA